MKKFNFLLFALIFINSALAQKTPQLGEVPIKKVVKAMTLEEKARIVRGNGMDLSAIQESENGVLGSSKDKVPGAAGSTFAIERLGIPSTVLSDGPAGLRIDPTRANDNHKYYATAWPIATLQASSWDPKLTEKIANAYGEEAVAYGVDIVLAPGMNIQKNTLNGRNFEYYSEDPLLSGKMAAAFTRGIQKNGVGVSLKHYVANNQETNRNSVDVIVRERALREIYLRGFEIAIKEANPWTVMSSYNKVNGTYAPQNHDLITKVLREDWGFDGYVMTDWFGGDDPVAQMAAGNDMIMPGTEADTPAIIEAVKSGKLSEKDLDRNVTNILKVTERTLVFNGVEPTNEPNLTAHAELAKTAATEGMVLLKNNDALPIKAWKSVALFGVNSYELVAGGTGSGNVYKPYTSSLEIGFANEHILIDEDITSAVKKYMTKAREEQPKSQGFMAMIMGTPPLPRMPISTEMAKAAAAKNDIAVYTIGRNSGEFFDRKREGDFELNAVEQNNITTLSEAFRAAGKKLVVLINAGGTVEVDSWRAKADAILVVWQAGLEGGNSIAEVISGAVNPSGKLPMTFPKSYDDMASSNKFPGVEDKSKLIREFVGTKIYAAEVEYDDDIYVGYRYFDTFEVEPAYEFGFGLSYTTFELSDLQLSNTEFDKTLEVSVKVTNTGSVAGKEVVQLYLSAPAKNIHKPVKELRAFGKTDLLAPGASQTIQLSINARDLSSFDEVNNHWVAEKGTYTVLVGTSSKAIAEKANFSLNKELVVEKTTNSLVPEKKLSTIK